MALPHRPDVNLSPREIEVIDTYVWLGSQKKVADRLGISIQTVKNTLNHAYQRLEVQGGIIGAMHALGYIHCPRVRGASPCGWLAYCGRHENHDGDHGDWQAFCRLEG